MGRKRSTDRPDRGALPVSATSVILLCATVSLLLVLLTGNVKRLLAQTGLEPEESADAFQGIIATAINQNPEKYPQMGVWLRTRDIAYLSVLFPSVPGLRLDSWIYESSQPYLSLESVNVVGEHQLEFRHQFRKHPGVIHVTTVTAEPGAIEIRGRLEADEKKLGDGILAQAADASLGIMHRAIEGYSPWVGERVPGNPDLAPDICYQLMRAPAFQSMPPEIPRWSAAPSYVKAYWEFVKRTFIFTDEGLTFLHKTDRTEIASKHDLPQDDPRNRPPLAQGHFGVWQDVPKSTYCSPTRYVYPVMGVVSIDGKHLVAVASESPWYMFQAWIDCVHDYARFLPADAPVAERTWRRKFYAMENNPDALLARVARDFPKAMKLKDRRTGTTGLYKN